MNMSDPFYEFSGTLSPKALSYVERDADIIFLDAIRNNQLCYIFNTRQTGKSSLIAHCREILEAEGYLIIPIDLSDIGTQQITADQWYASIVNKIAYTIEIHLPPSFSFVEWWNQNSYLTSLQCFSNFLEQIVLKHVHEKVLIAIDEIDSVLSLNFPTDDFFAFIRACYNKRSTNRLYQRLNFTLLGVATPSGLIADVKRTPFNLGQAIELKGFTIEKASKSLLGGLKEKSQDSIAVLDAILAWTKGQPFLTQKLCYLVTQSPQKILMSREVPAVANLVDVHLIQDWEKQDTPQHFRTIQNRIEHSRHGAANLLALYRQLLENGGSTPLDNSALQAELQLAGLVRREGNTLTIYNPIYQTIFDLAWVERTLDRLRPYTQQLDAWVKSGRQDTSRLLRGKALKDANNWASVSADYLTLDDRDFLDASRQRTQAILAAYSRESSAAPEHVATILEQIKPEIIDHDFIENSGELIASFRLWVGAQPELTKLLWAWMRDTLEKRKREGRPIQEGQENLFLYRLIESRLNSSKEAKKHFESLKTTIRQDPSSQEIVALYQTVQGQQGTEYDEDSVALRQLVKYGLIEIYDGQLYIANRFYEYVFNEQWVEDMLNRRIIDRYDVLETLREECDIDVPLGVYRVDGLDLPGAEFYVLQNLKIPDENAVAQAEAREIWSRQIKVLEHLKQHPSLPTLISYRPLYVVYREVIGTNLDKEILPGKRWDEDQAIDLFLAVFEILVLAHKQGLAHLNLKPENIRRREDGTLALIDFSILKEAYAATTASKEVNPIELIGTKGYIPPEMLVEGAWDRLRNKEDEQWIPELSDGVSVSQTRQSWDIYSVGIIALYALTGLIPDQLNQSGTQQILWRYIHPGDSRSTVSAGLANILDRLVHPDPSRRYQSAQDVIQDLARLKWQRRWTSRLAWANPRKRDWRFWVPATVVGFSMLAGTHLRTGFIAAKAEQQREREALIRGCVQSVRSNTLSNANDGTDLIDRDVIEDVINLSGSCDRYLNSSPSITFQRFLQSTFEPQTHSIAPESGASRLLDDDLNALISLGKASLILQQRLDSTSRAEELQKAARTFNEATEKYPGEPLGYFYGATTEKIEGEDDYSLTKLHIEALTRYLLMSLPNNPEKKDLAEFAETELGISNVQRPLSPQDFPVLIVLAYLWSQEPRLDDLLMQHKGLQDLGYFDVIHNIYESAKELNGKSVSVIYNEAVANAIAGNRQIAIGKFVEVLRESTDDAEEKLATRSLGFMQALLQNFDAAIDLLSQESVGFNKSWERDYLANLKACQNNNEDCNVSDTNWRNWIGREGVEEFNDIFPYQPVLECRQHIPIALAYPDLCYSSKPPEPSS